MNSFFVNYENFDVLTEEDLCDKDDVCGLFARDKDDVFGIFARSPGSKVYIPYGHPLCSSREGELCSLKIVEIGGNFCRIEIWNQKGENIIKME